MKFLNEKMEKQLQSPIKAFQTPIELNGVLTADSCFIALDVQNGSLLFISIWREPFGKFNGKLTRIARMDSLFVVMLYGPNLWFCVHRFHGINLQLLSNTDHWAVLFVILFQFDLVSLRTMVDLIYFHHFNWTEYESKLNRT